MILLKGGYRVLFQYCDLLTANTIDALLSYV